MIEHGVTSDSLSGGNVFVPAGERRCCVSSAKRGGPGFD
jgi:hypothetical protein